MTISMPKPFLFFVIGYLPFAVAWRPIGHYAVARECGVTHEEAGLYNLPDAWPPHIAGFITDTFCWSHSVARNGRNGLIPNVPVERYDREPGKMIKELVEKNKVIHWSADQGSTRDAAFNTAKYFTGHNAADKPVHWEYFGGGISLEEWTTNHNTKEEWADYAILMWLEKIVFNAEGSIDTFWGNQISANIQPMPFDINCINFPIIVLAQKIARKNRFILDVEDEDPDKSAPNTYNTVESVEDVYERLQDLAAEINGAVRGMNQDRWLTDLLEIALVNNWMTVTLNDPNGVKYNFSDMIENFNSAKTEFVK